MATIRRTDIIQKKFSKGRPPKTDRERINRRQEAYKWRDARRVYLASSFDRWRKLRSTLKMKDSSLAWHLMEAHEKSSCSLCRQTCPDNMIGNPSVKSKRDQKEFLPSLIASVRQLCHSYFDFEESIEIVGLLCLEFDKKRKENFSLNELIKSGLKPSQPNYISNSLHEKSDSSLSNNQQVAVQNADGKFDLQCEANMTTPPVVRTAINTTPSEILSNACLERQGTSNEPSHSDTIVLDSSNKSSSTEALCVNEKDKFDLKEVVQASNDILSDIKDIEKAKDPEASVVMDSSLCSESDPSLEIDIEKMDTSQEQDNSLQETLHNFDNVNTNKNCTTHSDTLIKESSTVAEIVQEEFSHTSKIDAVKNSQCNSGLKNDSQSSLLDQSIEIQPITAKELPLDMSVLKSTFKQEPTNEDYPDGMGDDLYYTMGDKNQLDVTHHPQSHNKRKMTETNHNLNSSFNKSLLWNSENSLAKSSKQKEEGHTSIPWQRRDMSRKEEYEFLEFHPFSDLAEFSQHYPHVHQRTYYRWKRRIKEEYIILEQCPDMSFQEFSSIVLQAKESVFHLWKTLISQGKGFFAPSDSSKRLEAKCSLKSNTSTYNNEYIYLQKNLSINYEQFSQQYPGVPLDVFNVLKRKVMQDFWLYYQNQHMSYTDFSMLANIGEDTFLSWKEYIENLKSCSLSPSIKALSNSMSPSSMSGTSFQSVGSPKSSKSDLQAQMKKDSVFNMMAGNSVFSDSMAAMHPSLNSSLNDSVSRNLSATYLASLQNMMFPWHSYYGMASPLGQQILPMMLWPQMMGLANPLTSIGSSHGTNLALSNSVSGLHSSVSDRKESPKPDVKPEESQSQYQGEHFQQGLKRLAEDGGQETSKSSSDKRMKLLQDKDDPEFWGSAGRSRKQNKQEYIYYLKNPELGFKELETLFPSISLRTFYRWRKEMNAAVLLLEENKEMTYHQFQIVFPDIPEEVFDSWKERAEMDKISRSSNVDQTAVTDNTEDVNADVKPSFPTLHMQVELDIGTGDIGCNSSAKTSYHSVVGDETSHHKKYNKEEYMFVQRNPDVDFATFSKLYPSISVRSFYRWKKELKETVDYLKANPDVDFNAYRTIDSNAAEEVFNVWKKLANNDYHLEECTEIPEAMDEKDGRALCYSNRKLYGPEYWFLQLNPYIEFSQFSRTYPDVPKRTFYRWKREIQQILNYIRAQPTLQYSDIASILPEVSQEVFNKWKETIAEETTSNAEGSSDLKHMDMISPQFELNGQTKDEMTKALLHLMHNPTMKYSDFKVLFEFMSPATFELWLKRIKAVILHIASNPSIDYKTFSLSIKDVAEDTFHIWKNLKSDEIKSIELSCEEARGSSRDNESCPDNLQKCYEYCLQHPYISFTEFSSQFSNVSEQLFDEWKSKINQEIDFLSAHPDVEFEEFSKKFPHTKEFIFNNWKSYWNNMKFSSINQYIEQSSENIATTALSKHNYSEQPPQSSSSTLTPNSIDHQINGDEYHRKSNDNLVSIKSSNDEVSNVADISNESSLSKLAKFAGSQSPGNTNKFLDDKQNSFSASLSDYLSNSQMTSGFSSISSEHKNNNNKVVPTVSPHKVDSFLHVPSTTSSIQQHYMKTSPLPRYSAVSHYNNDILPSQVGNSSLSALMAMSKDNEVSFKGNQLSEERLIPKKERVCNSSPLSGNSWQGVNWGSVKDEDEAFSSQRQKKMSRAEYMFVKDNPDVDSQEFSRIFPGVSARTFYRWKKEIKAQLQMA